VFTDKLRAIRESFREQGAALFLRAPFLTVKLFCLQRIFGFAKSNIVSARQDERYRTEAAALISMLKPETVVEFGSGLGNMIAGVAARKRIGFDTDRGAIAAAEFLRSAKGAAARRHSEKEFAVPSGGARDTAPVLREFPENQHVRFFCASFLDSETALRTLAGIDVKSIDVLVLTNWIHKVPTDQILRGLAAIHSRIPVHYLLLETIKPEFTGCAHQLAAADLARFGDVLYAIEGDEVRSLHIVSMATFESNQLFRLRQAVASATGQTSIQP
jgi:hypothetical protein